MRLPLRLAELSDGPAIERLIARSARELGAGDYTPDQIESALQGVFGLDTQLITDRTYFVAEADARIVACGGWSFRKTLFGSDSGAERDPESLDPSVDAAKIRAFFVDPDFVRRGLGTAILDRCELEAGKRGFSRAELMATLTGLKLYVARGFRGEEVVDYELLPGLTMPLVPMEKPLGDVKV